MAKPDEEADDDKTVLDDTEALIAKSFARIRKAGAVPDFKAALEREVFPALESLLEAVKDVEDRISEELRGDDDENGDLDDIEDRLDDVEERLGMMAAGLEMRVRLAALARSVQVHAADRPNLVTEATDALSFIDTLEAQVREAIEASREEAGAEQPEQPAEPAPAPTPPAEAVVAAAIPFPTPARI